MRGLVRSGTCPSISLFSIAPRIHIKSKEKMYFLVKLKTFDHVRSESRFDVTRSVNRRGTKYSEIGSRIVDMF